MDRFALFIDAGYLYAEGGKLCVNSSNRNDVRVDGAADEARRMSHIQRTLDLLVRSGLQWHESRAAPNPAAARQVLADGCN